MPLLGILYSMPSVHRSTVKAVASISMTAMGLQDPFQQESEVARGVGPSPHRLRGHCGYGSRLPTHENIK